MPANEHLLAALTAINNDARIVDASTHIDGVGLTHIVVDADGETLGRGTSEDAAIADAITCEFAWTLKRLEDCRQAVRAYKSARIELDRLF